jgi:vacuolar-type H+-ATPase catalytic subunit A/Vma1
MDPQEIFRECKNFVEKSDYENLAIQIKNLDDDDHIKYLCLQLNDKLDEKCNLINKEADSLNRLDENALYRFKDSLEEIKRVKLILNNYIDESMASKINETIDQKDVLELFSKKKADQELLSLVGTEILSEINELKGINSTVIKDKLLAENSDIKIQSNKQNSIFNSEKETTENKLTSMLISFQNGLQAFTAKKLEAFNPEIEKLRKATDLLNA